MANCAIYARAARFPQVGACRIEQQVQACQASATAHGMTVKAIYRDQGRSERSALNAMMQAVSAGELDVVVVDDLNRLSRAEPERSRILEDLIVAGVAVIVRRGGMLRDDAEMAGMPADEGGQLWNLRNARKRRRWLAVVLSPSATWSRNVARFTAMRGAGAAWTRRRQHCFPWWWPSPG